MVGKCLSPEYLVNTFVLICCCICLIGFSSASLSCHISLLKIYLPSNFCVECKSSVYCDDLEPLTILRHFLSGGHRTVNVWIMFFVYLKTRCPF